MPFDFKKLLTARFLFTFAVQMQAVVLGWRVYELLRDPLYLGLVGLAEAVPALGLALYAGYIIDRSRPLIVYRRVMYVSFLSGLVVLIENIFQGQLTLGVQVALLYGASFLTGLARSFSQPAIYASVPRLVERGRLLQASAMTSIAMQVANIGGPAAGGLIFGFFGASMSSTLVCVMLLCATIAMFSMKAQIAPPQNQPKHASVKDEILSGGKFVFKHPILFPALTLDMVSVLFGGVTALLPIFAEEILFVGPRGLGYLRAAPAIGATIISIYLSRNSTRMRTGKWLLSAVGAFGVCMLVFGLSRDFYLSMFALAISGAVDGISMVIRSSAVQLVSPDHMRGKISAVNSIFIGSSNELGELESGLAARAMGTLSSVYFGGIVCLLTVAATAYFAPALRNMDLAKLKEEKS